jgi:hypothetical protein
VSAAARSMAVVVGVAGVVLALAAAVREIVLASDVSVHWHITPALQRLTTSPSGATWAVAAGLALAGVALLVLDAWQLGGTDEGPQVVQFKDEQGWARLDVRAVQRGLRRRLQASVPGLTVREVRLRKEGDTWRVVVTADAPARDLQQLRSRLQAMVGQDLLRMGGMRLRRLDLVVDRLGAP